MVTYVIYNIVEVQCTCVYISNITDTCVPSNVIKNLKIINKYEIGRNNFEYLHNQNSDNFSTNTNILCTILCIKWRLGGN